MLLSVSAWAFRPFVSTDAAVADPREVEIELGYFIPVGRTEGLLQDKPGLSVAIETGLPLPPTVAGEREFGFETIAIVSGKLTGVSARSRLILASLDDPVRAQEKRWRNYHPQRLGGLQVDQEFELGRLLDW